MDPAVPILVIFLVVVAMVVAFYVSARLWRLRHTCDKDFWRRGGW